MQARGIQVRSWIRWKVRSHGTYTLTTASLTFAIASALVPVRSSLATTDKYRLCLGSPIRLRVRSYLISFSSL